MRLPGSGLPLHGNSNIGKTLIDRATVASRQYVKFARAPVSCSAPGTSEAALLPGPPELPWL